MFQRICAVICMLIFLCSCQGSDEPLSEITGEEIANIEIKSSAFKEGDMIPMKYTCDGEDVSPPLSWSSVPKGTKSLVLICDDPDAPLKTWVHWVLFNLPPNVSMLPENLPPQKILENGGKHGTSSFKKIGYGGPCPPFGTHRYFFKLYALDIHIDLDAGAKKKQLIKAMAGHVIARGQLMGNYKKK
ncbi:MAG: YbhB/YbcL family Raf kinase inhibitor-like protein [Thermodesulfobacteriota bacterium]|nr:YbhB/YbcL family Raf kinase inhibitor-like protein [Thermodesulfobacteriota bacterium]